MGDPNFIVTGGSGFIGSNFIRLVLNKYPNSTVTNIDRLTYAGRGNNNAPLESDPRYKFIQEDICNVEAMKSIVQPGSTVVNFAAESHVDNSIKDSQIFMKTNVLGTHSILEAARQKEAKLFVQISTDEVYGSLGFDSESSKEHHILNPSSPYSASKAAAEMICLGNSITFKQPVIITRSSNNFGPFQFPEKVIPLFVTNLFKDIQVPLYGEGKNVRDWIHVEDNCEGIDTVIRQGKHGEIYNIGGGTELQNIELTKKILEKVGKPESFIKKVEDRLGHDLRYSLNCDKMKALGWSPKYNFDEALENTISWYRNNEIWWSPLKDTAGKRTS